MESVQSYREGMFLVGHAGCREKASCPLHVARSLGGYHYPYKSRAGGEDGLARALGKDARKDQVATRAIVLSAERKAGKIPFKPLE
jgi:hypothetical protein